MSKSSCFRLLRLYSVPFGILIILAALYSSLAPQRVMAESLAPIDSVRRFFCEPSKRRIYRSKDEVSYERLRRKKARERIRALRQRRKTASTTALQEKLTIRIRGIRRCLRGDIETACSVVEESTESSSQRIINGQICDKHVSPIVPLELLNNSSIEGICSGTIIQSSPLIILSAAHCLSPSLSTSVTSVKATVGNEIHLSSEFSAHPDHVPGSVSSLGDIAIIHFSSSTSIPSMKPLSLQQAIAVPNRYITAGYGNTTPGVPPTGIDGELRATDIRVVDQFGASIVANSTEKTGGICTGDSGGPLLVQMNSGEWRIAGVSSYLLFTNPNSQLCDTDNTNVYASVTYAPHLSFIQESIPNFGLD